MRCMKCCKQVLSQEDVGFELFHNNRSSEVWCKVCAKVLKLKQNDDVIEPQRTSKLDFNEEFPKPPVKKIEIVKEQEKPPVTGFSKVNEQLGGVRKGELITIGGKSNVTTESKLKQVSVNIEAMTAKEIIAHVKKVTSKEITISLKNKQSIIKAAKLLLK